MLKNYALKADVRDEVGKGASRALRREQKVPAVIYGDSKSPVTITLPSKEATLEFHKGHMFTTLCDLHVDGEKHLVLARDVQLHPVKDTLEHIDFLRVTQKTKLTVSVPVQFVNEDKCPGLLEKGVFNINRYDVDIVCKAVNIPESIEIDMSTFEIGDAIKISDAIMPEGAKPAIDDRDFTIAIISAPRRLLTLEEEEEAAAAAEAEADAANAEGEDGGGDAEEGEEASDKKD